MWCWRRLLRVPWTAKRSNQSNPKEINPGCSLEGLMLKLKLQYFGHLMRSVDYLNIVKAIYDKPTANIILNGEKKHSPKIRNKTRVSTFTTIIQNSFGSPSYSNQRRKINQRNPDWKRRKLLLLADDMILYIEKT